MTYCAASPHHITALFSPHIGSRAEESGSVGVGIAVEPRARVCISEGEPLSSSPISTVRRATSIIGASDLSAKITTPLPPGVGFAVSASTSIAASLAAGATKGLTLLRSLAAAHEAEILERTGLGDVLAISCGVGLVFRLRPGAPGIGLAECKQLPGGLRLLAAELRREHTSEFVSRYLARGLHEAARSAMAKIADSFDFHAFAEEVMRFNVENGLFREAGVEDLVRAVPGLVAAYVKKGVLLMIVEEDRLREAAEMVLKHKLKPYYLEPSKGGPTLEVR